MLSGTAHAFDASTNAGDVTIQEDAVGSQTNTVTWDQIGGQYDEVFSTTSPTTFNTLAIFNALGYTLNTAAVASQINAAFNGYGLYALFQADGDFTITGGNQVTFTGDTGVIELWVDKDQDTDTTGVISSIGTAIGNDLNTVKGALRGSTSDDMLLGSASVLSFGEGNGTTDGEANGNFELIFSEWVLTALGGDFFIAPNPFYTILDLNGNFQEFNPTSQTDILLLGNSANGFFVSAVPTPGTLALIGLGLLGLGSARRSKAKSIL